MIIAGLGALIFYVKDKGLHRPVKCQIANEKALSVKTN